MKRFYKNAISFSILFAIVFVLIDILSMRDSSKYMLAKWTDSESFIAGNVGAGEIIPYIEKVQTKDGTTKLLLGDSVCHQIFNGLQECNPEWTIVGSNGAVTMAGQYILAKEYLDAHPEATDVFLILLPESFSRTYDTLWGYQYVVMPFAETNTLNNLDADTIKTLKKTYGGIFLNPGIVKLIDRSAMNRKVYLNYIHDHSKDYVLKNYFELADQYVYKIYEMCNEKNVNFHLYPCPVADAKIDYNNSLLNDFSQSKIYEINPDYMDMVYYFPVEEANDTTHFSGEYANQEHFNSIIRQMFEGLEILDMLKLQ